MKFIFILALSACILDICFSSNYLDTYFCSNEICNAYWQACDSDTEKASQYCTGRDSFLICTKVIPTTYTTSQKNSAYEACKSYVTYSTAGQYFYFLNCQVNCGYQALWLSCSTQINEISSCQDGENCPMQSDYNAYNTQYQACEKEIQPKCKNIYYKGNFPLVESDCNNSVSSQCKQTAATQTGKSNTFVQLLLCEAVFSQIMTISVAMLIGAILLM